MVQQIIIIFLFIFFYPIASDPQILGVLTDIRKGKKETAFHCFYDNVLDIYEHGGYDLNWV